VDAVQGVLSLSNGVVDSGNITRDENLSLHRSNIQAASSDDGIATSNETCFTGGGRGQGEGREGSDAENEDGLEREHVDCEGERS